MLQTIEAVIDTGGQIRFLEPVSITKTKRALVTFLNDESEPELPGQRMVDILEEIAHLNGAVSKIAEPVQWQREIRQDRALPFGDRE